MTTAKRILFLSVGSWLCCAGAMAQYKKTTPTYTPPPAPAYTPPPRPAPSYTPPPSRPAPEPAPTRSYTPPSAPAYTPPPSRPAPTYTPPASTPRPASTYTPPASTPRPASTYAPGSSVASTPRPASTYTPGTSAAPAPRTYTPGSSAPATAAHTYTPGSSSPATAAHTYTPGSSSSPSPSAARTYTPGSSSSTSSAARTYTPGSSSTTYTPGVSRSGSATTYTPAASSSGVRTSTGTVYTPGASSASRSGTSYTPAATLSARPGGQPYGAAAARPIMTPGVRLDTTASVSTIHQLNASRAGLSGINRAPLPTGAVTPTVRGGFNIAAAGGRELNVRRNGTIAAVATPRERVTFTPAGRIHTVHTSTVDIYHGPRGAHVVIEHRPGNAVLVATGRRMGYLQRPFARAGGNFVARTYLGPRGAFTRVYAGYRFHGALLYGYVPMYAYAPDFYGWAFYPWGAPAYYRWAWAGAPWYGHYGRYFGFASAYANASLWLADYYLGQTLADAYSMQAGDPGAPPADSYDVAAGPEDDPDAVYAQQDTPISPEMKQAIADEVQQQLSYENAAAQRGGDEQISDLPQAMTPNHYFVVATPQDVVTADGQTCSLEAGNVLKLMQAPTDAQPAATLMVSASRRMDCPAGVQVALSMDQLEDMENNFRADLDSGLQTLHAQQGTGGLPAAPQSAIAPPPRPLADPPADQPNVAGMLATAQADAARTESSAASLAMAAPAPGGSH